MYLMEGLDAMEFECSKMALILGDEISPCAIAPLRRGLDFIRVYLRLSAAKFRS